MSGRGIQSRVVVALLMMLPLGCKKSASSTAEDRVSVERRDDRVRSPDEASKARLAPGEEQPGVEHGADADSATVASPPSRVLPTTKRDDERCADLSLEQRIVFCGPAAGEEVFGYVSLKEAVTGTLLSTSGQCFSSVAPRGQTSFLPPLDAKCHLGPLKKCLRVEHPKERWEYSFPSAEEDPAWGVLEKLGWKKREYVWTHIRIKWEQRGDECFYWVEGLADTDGDGLYSHIEIASVARGDTRDMLERKETPEHPGVRLEDVLK